MKMVVDRFEGELAICEDIKTRVLFEYPISSLPEGVSPGDVLIRDGCKIIIDQEETEERRNRINVLFEDLWD